MRKIILYLFLSLIAFANIVTTVSAQQKTTIYLFWSDGCPHCAKEKSFLDKLSDKYPSLEIKKYEISKSQENRLLLIELGKKLNVDVSGVPFTVIGDKYFLGYLSDETTGKKIEEAAVLEMVGGSDESTNNEIDTNTNLQQDSDKEIPEAIQIPIFGTIELKNISLPFLTFIIALLDGFNPCAMWTLLFLITLLIGMKDRKRMWILGSAFIVTSGFVYFVFLSAWLNLFLFVGLIAWVRIAVGIFAIGAGVYYLWDFCTNKTGGCKFTEGEKRQLVFEKIKTIVAKKNIPIALVGIIILALAVNMVELVCSAGLPAIYTQVLSLSNLPRWQYYMYLLFYVLVFMIDDLFIFVVAMFTFKTTGIQGKYSRYSHFVGGFIMLIIGLLLIFKPGLLMFG